MFDPKHPHGIAPVLYSGAVLAKAKAAMMMIHGRGATAESILELAQEFFDSRVAYLAPQAAGNTWYPDRFLAPLERNEPYLSSALRRIGEVVGEIEQAGISAERIVLLGFSQGACLALEYAARNARRYGGIIALSGGVIGPDGLTRNDAGSLVGTPVFLGCSDVDFHIPKPRVEHAAQVMAALGGDVTMRLYPDMGHTVNTDELAFVGSLLQNMLIKPE